MSFTKDIKAFVLTGILLILFLSALLCHAHDNTIIDEKEIIESYNKTALLLYENLKKKPGNVVFSPYGIGTAMAMALSGANGETEKEMAKVLNHKLPKRRMDSANAKVLGRMDRFKNNKEVTLSLANALCLTVDSFLVHMPYKKRLIAKYSAEIFDAKDIISINAWVAKKTHGKIDRILENLSPNSVCVLLNAVYFKGLWAFQFDKKLTRSENFYAAEDLMLSVPTMHHTARFPLIKYDNFMAIAMPYKVDSLAMVIILPNDRTGLPGVEEKLTIKMVQAILNDLEKSKPMEVMLSLPKFKIGFGSSLIPTLESLGMKLPFSDEMADFGGISGIDNALGLIWISQIQHKVFLEVNEEGSEAAATTAGEFKTKSASGTINFEADHPFLFVLVDKTTNAILFIGRINNPLE